MAVSLKKHTIDLYSCKDIGTAAKKVITSMVENLGLTVISVETDTTSDYSVNVKYGNDDNLMINIHTNYVSYNGNYICIRVYRKTDIGDYSILNTLSSFAKLTYGDGISFSYTIISLGESKILKCGSLLGGDGGFLLSTVLNTVDNSKYTFFSYINISSYSNFGITASHWYSFTGYIANANNEYKKIETFSNASDTLIPSDGKVYLVPVRVRVNDWNLIGLIGGKENWYRAYCNVDGGTSTPIYLPGQPVAIGGVSGIGFGNLVYVDK